MTVREAARLLGLHPQTVYRKCARNEIESVRFGRTLRISERALRSNPTAFSGPTRGVPSFMQHLFWDVDSSKLEKTNPLVIERILELGDLPEIRWIFSMATENELKKFLERRGEKVLSPRSYHFWRKMLFTDEERDESKNSAEEATDALGETRWR